MPLIPASQAAVSAVPAVDQWPLCHVTVATVWRQCCTGGTARLPLARCAVT